MAVSEKEGNVKRVRGKVNNRKPTALWVQPKRRVATQREANAVLQKPWRKDARGDALRGARSRNGSTRRRVLPLNGKWLRVIQRTQMARNGVQ